MSDLGEMISFEMEEAKKAERERVPDEAINALKSDSCPDSKQRDCCDSYENCEICILESLRSEVSKE